MRKSFLLLAFSLLIMGKDAFAQSSLNGFDAKLTELAANMNKKMPMTDAPFRMDSVGTKPGKVMVYNYTIMGSDKLKLDYLATKESIEKKVIESLKNNPKMKGFKENDVTMLYNYYDEHGIKQIVIPIKAAQYK